jgi:hypothetical protein
MEEPILKFVVHENVSETEIVATSCVMNFLFYVTDSYKLVAIKSLQPTQRNKSSTFKRSRY